MASNFTSSLLLLLLLLLLPILPQTIATQPAAQENGTLNIGAITKALSDKGYIAMSLILEQSLPTLVPVNLTHSNCITIFCPTDEAVFASNATQPLLSVLQYQIVPMKIDEETLVWTLPFESRVDTLLEGHWLVVTTVPKYASLNLVKIKDWELYNDGKVIIHGTDEFFNQAVQSILPSYDEDNDGEEAKKYDTPKKASTSSSSSFIKSAPAILMILAGMIGCVVIVYYVVSAVKSLAFTTPTTLPKNKLNSVV